MKPEVQEALNLLYNTTGQLQLSRPDHEKIQNAFNVLVRELTPKPEDKKDLPKEEKKPEEKKTA